MGQQGRLGAVLSGSGDMVARLCRCLEPWEAWLILPKRARLGRNNVRYCARCMSVGPKGQVIRR